MAEGEIAFRLLMPTAGIPGAAPLVSRVAGYERAVRHAI